MCARQLDGNSHGGDVKFWTDSWVSEMGLLIDYVSSDLDVAIESTMADMATLDSSWRWTEFQHLLPRYVLLRIAAICWPNPHLPPD
ncbi:hypothetical protein V6N13_073870 [Hibiscus sabdariffa]